MVARHCVRNQSLTVAANDVYPAFRNCCVANSIDFSAVVFCEGVGSAPDSNTAL